MANQLISKFLDSVIATRKKGGAGEHSYRPALQRLFDSLEPNKISALNEPKREKVGAPDFSISRGDIVIGHCEAKDIDVDLKTMKDANLAQKKRYIGGLQNLLYTNCLEWVWYRDGELKHEVRIADFLMGIQPLPNRFAALEAMLRDFIAQSPQTITSSRALAERMAGKTVLIKDVLANTLMQDKDQETELTNQYKAFQQHLIHDISIADFADMYAETITYGMFAARLHDTTKDTFSRQEALDLLPKSNPFLRNLFGYIAGPNLDPRISWIIDDLASVFRASDVSALMAKFGKTTQRNDPFLHFYEDFLKAYNPAKRDARGVWYTPEPVVNFIVRAINDVLKTEFGLEEGLADTSKVTIEWDTGQRGTTKAGKLAKSAETVKGKKEVHRVQILDPATGTGTFLAEVIKQVAPHVKAKAPGLWAKYVEKDLIPRLHGFELLMASYAMCHMKLDMVLREHGYKPTAKPPRVSVYLTNSLEEGDAANYELPFAQWLSNEAREANTIKRDMPIMCVIGNPPYRGESVNKGDWIMNLIEAYKREPGGREKLKERNSKWINDDYVKFIRMAEALIEKNGQGVLGFITNHGYLDNPTFRGMRWRLLQTFDKIYVIDLHGSTLKKEVAPGGQPDKNVFDIPPGVAIVIAVKRAASRRHETQVYHADVWGPRDSKYELLRHADLTSLKMTRVASQMPSCVFVPRNTALLEQYESGIHLEKFMPLHGNGIVTKRDFLSVRETDEEVQEVLRDFLQLPEIAVREKYQLPEDVRDWRYEWAKADISANFQKAPITPLNYRPFQEKKLFYSGISRGFVGWPVPQVMRHYVGQRNIGLLAPKAVRDAKFAHVFVTTVPTEAIFLSGTTGSNAMNFPLYLYPEPDELDQTRRVNFESKLYAKLRKLAKHPKRGEPDEVAVFDYIYGVLHCPAYRETYAEFLKIDYPRIPWPATPDVFWEVSYKGEQLRRLHLMEPVAIGKTPYPFVGDGNTDVGKIEFRDGAVWINATQRFENAPDVSWSFYVGGYQPAQKWLKDRKGRSLDFEDVKHYQRILKVLAETDRIMKTIDMPLGA
ncbi:MAG: type ISP restriction/modification enzyme [Hyphomonadaceae bacterium]